MRAMDTSVPVLESDLAEIFPELGLLRDQACSGDLGPVLPVLRRIRSEDVLDHAVSVEVVAVADGVDRALETLLEAHPEDRELRTLHAARILFSDEPGALVETERLLVRQCAEDPGDPTAWYLRLVAAGRAGLPRGEARRRYDRLRAAAGQDHPLGQRVLVECFHPPPGGSWTETLEVAATVSEYAPDGSEAHAVVPATYLASWLDRGPTRDVASLRVPGVVDEIDAAAKRFGATRCSSRYGWVAAHTAFAVTLGLAGRRASSTAHFRALGPLVDRGIWTAVADHHDDLLAIRDLALAQGRRR